MCRKVFFFSLFSWLVMNDKHILHVHNLVWCFMVCKLTHAIDLAIAVYFSTLYSGTELRVNSPGMCRCIYTFHTLKRTNML